MINILEKIDTLKAERHWSEYQLAEKSGLTQSTISSWYRKNMLPTIPSLELICKAFGITLSQFFLEEEEETVVVELTQSQMRLIHYAARLAPEQYDALLKFLETL